MSTSCLPEIVEDAALLVDPHRVEDIQEKMCLLVENRDLREQLRRRGLERASYFSWTNTAKQTVAAYEQAAALE